MAYESKSLFVKPPVNGLRVDVLPSDVPEGSAVDLMNLLKRDGRVVVRPGYATLGGNLTNRIAGLVNYKHSGGNQLLVAATTAGWYAWDTATQAWIDITLAGSGLTTGTDDFNIFRVFYKAGTSYLVGVNGYADEPKKWDGDTAHDYADVGGTPGNAKCIAALADRMLLANFSGAPLEVDVSAFNDFESGWGATQTAVLADTPGEIVSMNEMGALVACIYKSDAWYVVTATAGQYPFSFALRQADIAGPVSAAAVVPTPIGHFILAKDCNVYRCDGSSYTPVGEHVRAAIYNNVSMDRIQKSFGFYNKTNNEVWFMFPGKAQYYTSPNRGVVIKADGSVWPVAFDMDYIQPTAGLHTILETMATIGSLTNALSTYTSALSSYTARQEFQLLGSSNGDVLREYGNLDKTDSISFSYESPMQAPSPERKFFTTTELEYYFTRATHSQSFVGYLFYSDENVINTAYKWAEKALNIPGPAVFGTRVTSRLFKIGLSGYASGPIEYEGCRVSGIERGRR